REDATALEGSERVQPLPARLRGLIIEQPLENVAVTFARRLGFLQPAGDFVPNADRREGHTLTMHYLFVPGKPSATPGAAVNPRGLGARRRGTTGDFA